jgi:hypothetical protein
LHPLLGKLKEIVTENLCHKRFELKKEDQNFLWIDHLYPGGRLPLIATYVKINSILLSTPLSGSISQISDLEIYKCAREFFDELQKKSGMWIAYDPKTGRFAAAIKIGGLLSNFFMRTDLADQLDDAVDEFHDFIRNCGSEIAIFLASNSLPRE